MTEATRVDEREVEALEDRSGGDPPLVRAWVPDHRSPEFEARLTRESAIIAASPGEREIMQWLDQVRDTRGWVWEE